MFGGQGLSIKVIIIIFFFLRFVIVIKNYCMAVLFDLTSVSVHSMLFQLLDFTLSFTIFDVQIHLFFKVLFYNCYLS